MPRITIYSFPFLVNGVFSQWQDWAHCSLTCGGGNQIRTRTCEKPTPQHGGLDCTATGSTDSETRKCNENECPSKFI